MRKQDRNKNIEQANLMLEQSYLKSKGLLKENMYGDTSNKYGNHGVGRADSPANTGGGEAPAKEESTATHDTSGMKVNVYSNGIIEFCKKDQMASNDNDDDNDNYKMVDVYKYDSDSSRHGGFEAVKNYFEEMAGKDIDKFSIFNSSKMQYAGTLLQPSNFSRDWKCGDVNKISGWSKQR
jgi:hypothetical protein